jgi:hypothetical protein
MLITGNREGPNRTRAFAPRIVALIALPFLAIGGELAYAAAAHTSRMIGETNETTPLPANETPPDIVPPDGRSRPPPDDISEAVGWWRPPGCTVFHIGNGRGITAGHCVLPAGRGSNLPCRGTIEWGVRQEGLVTTPDPNTSTCLKVVTATNQDEVDFAVVRFDVAPSAVVHLSTRNPARNASIQILGYPAGPPLAYLANGCNLHFGNETQIAALENKPWIVAYKCDTDRGSSGSPIFRTDDWTVIGVHNAGEQTDAGTNDGWNWGTPASLVLEALGDH